MIGKVQRMVMKNGREQQYTFIHGENGKEYFLHISSMKRNDEWYEIAGMVSAGTHVKVKFTEVNAAKGMRADEVEIVPE